MAEPIRIAQVIGNAANGGVESVINNYYKFIDKNKFQFDFYVDSVSGIIRKEKIEALGGRVFITPRYQDSMIAFQKYLFEQFKKEKYLIVHSNMNALSYFVLKIAKKADVPIRIAHSHSTANKKELIKTAIKDVLRLKSKTYATDYFACSEVAGRWLFGNKAFDKGQVKIINNGIEIEEFKFSQEKRITARKEVGIPEDAFVIGNIGRFVKQKNQAFLIDVFKGVLEKRDNAYLLFVGEGPLEQSLINKAKELKVDNRVIFAGTHKHPARFYDAMDVFALPSLYEGLGMVGVEAQANGIRCIFSDNVPNEVDCSNTSLFISIVSAEPWVNCILEQPNESFNERSEEYKKIIGGKFDISLETLRLQSFYDGLLKISFGDI